MTKTQRLVGALRALLALALAALLLGQLLLLPAMHGDWSRTLADPSTPTWPMLVVPFLELLCVQVVVVCTWRLLAMVEQDRIFRDDSLVWVNTIVGAMLAAWLLLVALLPYAVAVDELEGLPVGIALLLVGGAVLGLLMVVMRALLRQATSLRTEMEAVV